MVGTYVLMIDVPAPQTITVGALGPIAFDAGAYAYVGSAFGPGGFARIDRHRDLAAGDRDVRHWHVDYLLGAAETALDAVVRVPDRDCECHLAGTIPGTPVDGFGASDCDCPAHLLALTYKERAIETALEPAGAHLVE